MLRTIITLSQDLKNWLDKYSREKKQSTAETIREALVEYRQKKDSESSDEILKKTSGIWKGRIESEEYVEKIRKEWENR